MCIRLANGINSFNGRFSKSLPNGRGSFVFDYDLATIEGPFNSGSLHGKTKMTNKQGNLQFSGRKREEGKLMELKRNRFFPFCPYRNSLKWLRQMQISLFFSIQLPEFTRKIKLVIVSSRIFQI